jgi:hypothetical protein
MRAAGALEETSEALKLGCHISVLPSDAGRNDLLERNGTVDHLRAPRGSQENVKETAAGTYLAITPVQIKKR